MSNPAPPSNRHIYLHLLPRTSAGWWSLGVAAGFILLFAMSVFLVQVADHTGIGVALTLFPAGVAAVLAGAMGVFAIVRRSERSVIVFLPVIVGLLVAWFVIGEIVSPH